MKRIDSDALGVVNKSLGITGAGAPQTELRDGEVYQVLEVGQIARRGRSLGPSGGIFTGILKNEHAGSGTLNTTLTPYVLPDDIAIAPYPQVVGPQFDLWLLRATIQRTAGTGSVVALLDVTYSAQGWGIADDDAQVIAAASEPVALWEVLVSNGVTFGILRGSEQPEAHINIRLARGAAITNPRLRFTTTATAIADYQCQVIMGMFPASLGQDGAF